VLAPKGTPKPIIDTLYTAFHNVVSDPEYQKSMESKGSVVLDYNPEQAKEFLKKQDELFKEIIAKTGTGEEKQQ